MQIRLHSFASGPTFVQHGTHRSTVSPLPPDALSKGPREPRDDYSPMVARGREEQEEKEIHHFLTASKFVSALFLF